MQWMGKHTCLLCGARVGSRDLTDGTFVWPEGLAHYVGEHGIRLPEWFHPFGADEVATRHEGTDSWLQWSAASSPPPDPMEAAMTLEAAQAFVDRQESSTTLRIVEEYSRWRLTAGNVVADFSPPLDEDALRIWVSPWRVRLEPLSIEQANTIADTYASDAFTIRVEHLEDDWKANVQGRVNSYQQVSPMDEADWRAYIEQQKVWELTPSSSREGWSVLSVAIILTLTLLPSLVLTSIVIMWVMYTR